MKKKNRVFLLPLFGSVIANYIAQIPYDIHLYHGRYNPVGTVLLLGTLVWFLAGYFLRRTNIGYWVLVAFLAVQVLFYFHNDVVLLFFGYGIYYHLFFVKDTLLWWVFLIGDINFFAAIYYLYYLLKNKSSFSK